MGLYPLAGPFPIQDEDGNLLSGAPDIYFWWPHVGLFSSLSFAGGGSGRCIIALDGIAHYNYGNYGEHFWPEKNLMVQLFIPTFPGNVGTEYTYEPRAGVQGVSPDQQDIWPGGFNQYCKFPGRRIMAAGTGVYEHRHGADSVDFLSAHPMPFGWFVTGTNPGRDFNEIWTRQNNGTGDFTGSGGMFYNVTHNEWSKVYYPGAVYYFRHFYYVPEWKIFLTVAYEDLGSEEAWAIRLWSMEVRPTIVTEPEVVQGTLRAGQVVTFRVQVTGDQDDPAEDELVEWALTGDVGLLLDEQSKTDVDGYATARVKIDVGETGTLDIEASVKC